MHQLFHQLVSNALKFCKVNPNISVSSLVVAEEDLYRHPELQKNVSYVSVSVIDNGIGFDQKYAEKIFSVFQQLRDIKTDGTGIGLAVCKKIIENHRGVIVANGKVDEGATFTVFLPAG
jgi:signal transduction histidine kinase